MRFILMVIGFSTMVLVACQSDSEPSLTGDDCGAKALQGYVGDAVTDHDFSSYQRRVRIIPLGSAVTMDHDPDRLNIALDQDDKIRRIYCG